MGEIIQDGSGDAKDRDLRLEYMYAKSTVLSVPTTTVSVTRRKQMEMQDCFREREVEEAGRQALLLRKKYSVANPVCSYNSPGLLSRPLHSHRRPSPIRFFSGKYRHKSLYTHFPRICSKTLSQINGITESG